MTTLERSSCDCDVCRAACRRIPGIFRPGEPERAAALLGLSPEAFAERFLARARMTTSPALVVLPALVGMPPGTVYAPYDRGTCVFLGEGDRCGIYEARPYGCAHGNPCERSPETDEAYFAGMDETARLWEAAL